VTEKNPLPIATPTIARLYMLQGKLQQAEALYRQLLQESPEDARLLDGLAEVRRRAEAAHAPAADRVEVRILGDAYVCTWAVTEEGQHRARLVLNAPGELVLRLASFPADPERAPEDRPLTEAAGTLVLPPISGRCVLVAAAVGVLSADRRFASITHCTAPSTSKNK
jgi:hypothetical protein